MIFSSISSHYSITYTQSLHAINSLLFVGRVKNLHCGRPLYIVYGISAYGLFHKCNSVQFTNMRGIKKETSRKPRNRNKYLYVRSIGPGCWGTCPTATQGGEWLSRKIPGAALWTSSARTAWRRRPKRIVFPSEPFLEDQKWRNRRERGMVCMEGDRVERLTHASASF